MLLTFIVLDLSVNFAWQEVQIVMTCIFVATFNASLGPALWLYIHQKYIVPSKGMAIVAFINMFCTAIFRTFTEEMFDLLTVEGFYITITCFLAGMSIFVFFLVKESKGKSRAELDYLYSTTGKLATEYSSIPGEETVEDGRE